MRFNNNNCFSFLSFGNSSSTSEYTVFVGDLTSEVSDLLLFQTFSSRYSSVKNAKVMIDSTTRQSRGYGFVKFSNEEESKRAIEEMNGLYLAGRSIRLSVAVQKKPTNALTSNIPSGSSSSASFSNVLAAAAAGAQFDPSDPNNSTIFIGGIDATISEDDLQKTFSPFGSIVQVKIPKTQTGCGFVTFSDKNEAVLAIQHMNGLTIGISELLLNYQKKNRKS